MKPIKELTSSILGGGGDSAASAPTVVQPPPVLPPPEMPVPDDANAKKAKRRAIVAQYAKRGRQSTILSDAMSETLG